MPKKKGKQKIVVEDHGNGYMVIGTLIPHRAAEILEDYVDNIEDYKFACPTWYKDQKACWLSTGPGDNWDGSTDPMGNPLPR